ncbi:peptidylprolyl isomerase CPR7 NDAI_0G04870 [Naumovozyma dairenensis CBS 421]|uniref:peptidylprolyl isomerase n=1 Tax=Naumovozyma dairenensis (strain ATCC 10597 / BCRC 20456 / CBS 421 / NBRC 0211 / NRRL Y-12639) TaxID=1071378 RepID=J7SBQ2_NAUDC|nr:hypothetical protein NDAI_0G04870 [Naumovozyma dairenensis CBS 421]CCK73470.1 hypothetical protein NDAI_0G04870 [Naumovozyma dairenensis CBS 421]
MNGPNKLVYLDISIDSKPIGRIVCQLFNDAAPKASNNFYHLCQGDVTIEGQSNPVTLKGNHFHRVIKNFMIQAGDIVYGSDINEKSDNIGKGGCSIFATSDEINSSDSDISCYGNFEDENLGEFNEPFYLAMANTGSPNTNSSQFFITTFASPHLNGKHSIFGEVIHGKSVVRTIENSPVDSDGFPASSIKIENCGSWEESMGVPLYNASSDPIGNDIYDENPTDDTHIEPDDFNAAYDAADCIKNSGSLLFKKKDFQNAYFKYRKSLKYVNEYIPEPDVDQVNNEKFTTLKMKLYLNLSLVLFNLKKLDDAILYCNYLLDMENVPSLDKAKAYYRRGNCNFSKKHYEVSLKDYKTCKEYNPDDKIIDQKIEQVEKILSEKKEKTKKSIAKFFS